MTYNLTAIVSNSTDYVSFAQGINNVLMFGYLGLLILLGLGAVIFIAFQSNTNDTRKSVGATSFICFGLALLLASLNLINELALFITLVGTALIVAFTWRN